MSHHANVKTAELEELQMKLIGIISKSATAHENQEAYNELSANLYTPIRVFFNRINITLRHCIPIVAWYVFVDKVLIASAEDQQDALIFNQAVVGRHQKLIDELLEVVLCAIGLRGLLNFRSAIEEAKFNPLETVYAQQQEILDTVYTEIMGNKLQSILNPVLTSCISSMETKDVLFSPRCDVETLFELYPTLVRHRLYFHHATFAPAHISNFFILDKIADPITTIKDVITGKRSKHLGFEPDVTFYDVEKEGRWEIKVRGHEGDVSISKTAITKLIKPKGNFVTNPTYKVTVSTEFFIAMLEGRLHPAFD